MADIWSDAARWEIWRTVEVLACEAWGKEGRIPARAAAAIRLKPKVKPAPTPRVSAGKKHHGMAFVKALGGTV